MGGIINGFIGGMGKAAADIGKMGLSNKLATERDEADALRTATLKSEEREFRTSEREAGQEFKASESAKKEKGAKERALISASKTRTKNPQLIKYTDSKGMEQQGVLKDHGDGTYAIVKPDTGETIEEKISSEDLKNMAAQMNTATGRASNWIPFDEYSKKDPEVRAAVVKKKAGKPSGVVAGKMKDEPDIGQPPEIDEPSSKETKQIGNNSVSRQDYIDRMVAKHGKDKLAQIEAQWDSY